MSFGLPGRRVGSGSATTRRRSAVARRAVDADSGDFCISPESRRLRASRSSRGWSAARRSTRPSSPRCRCCAACAPRRAGRGPSAFAHGRDLAVDQDPAGAADDVDDFLAVGMRVRRPHLVARRDADHAGRAVVGLERAGCHQPASWRPGRPSASTSSSCNAGTLMVRHLQARRVGDRAGDLRRRQAERVVSSS